MNTYIKNLILLCPFAAIFSACGDSGSHFAAPTTTTVISSSPTSTYGDSIIFEAMVTPPLASGTVTFRDGPENLGSGVLSNGTATFSTSTLSVGSHPVSAEYGGDPIYAASTSSDIVQTVNPAVTATLVSIAVTPANPVIAKNSTMQFTAVGTFSDNTKADLTSSVTWTSSDTTTATINNAGLATPVNIGQTTITAAMGGISGFTPLTITANYGYQVTLQANSNFVFAQTAVISSNSITQINTVNFIVHTKPGNNSKDINVTYSLDYLARQGYVHYDRATVEAPIFGLYSAYLNSVDLTVNWKDNTSNTTPLQIQTDAFTSGYQITNIVINKQYVNPKLSYILLDSAPDAPIILDIDGETRWQTEIAGKVLRPVYFDSTGFLVGLRGGPTIYKVNFKGEVIASYNLSDKRYSQFHHNIETGKTGLFAGVHFTDNTVDKPASVMVEMTPQGTIMNTWDFDSIIGGQIQVAGEDPLLPVPFVQNGVDWFHMNSQIYVPQDDSIIVSSRENFVIKIDYSTKKIKWIMGDPKKIWYQNYPKSLQPLALSISGKEPIGQHALSIVGDPAHLLLFNNGWGNTVLPNVGDNRKYSAVSLYEINESLMTANEIWTFDDGQAIMSPICSSVYKTASGDYLVDFATSSSGHLARIMVVDDSKNIYFDMALPIRSVTLQQSSCDTAYRAREIKLESLNLN